MHLNCVRKEVCTISKRNETRKKSVMIKLIDLSHTPPSIHLFETDHILIGSKQSTDPSYLYISDPKLEEKHLQIICQGSDKEKEYYIINLARDPFATLNNLPFGKQPLKNKALIQIGSTTLQVEIGDIAESALSKQHESTLDKSEIEDLMKKVEAMSSGSASIFINSNSQQMHENTSEEQAGNTESLSDQIGNEFEEQASAPIELKDYYYPQESDEEQDIYLRIPQEEAKDNEQEFKIAWSAIVKLLSAATIICLICFSVLFLWAKKRALQEEVMASKGAADIAMALIYTQIKHIRPQNQNWSDPEFIKNNLTAVLASAYLPFAEFDALGQFSQCPYMLRIYTNSEITRFLVLAQPAPSLLQWLIPKSTIIIDSCSMEMRKIKDLKLLNRLLVNTNTLDGVHAGEITSLVQKGELIPLQQLVNPKENEGFSPPKALGFIDPIAENLIYNAPRYYCLGENLIKKSQQILVEDSQHDAPLLIHEIFALKKLSHLVLYSSGGVQSAVEAQKALSALAPKEKFIIAYLHLNGFGKISSSQLLMDDTVVDNDAQESSLPHFALSSKFESAKANKETPLLNHEFHASNRGNDPLILELSEITSLHQHLLQSITNEMIALLKKQAKSSQPNFSAHFLELQKKLFDINDELKINAQQKLESILQESYLIPAANFVQLIREEGLENEFEDYLLSIRNRKGYLDSELAMHQVEELMRKIQSSRNWQELDYSTDRALKHLQFEIIPFIEPLIQLQREMKSAVIQKLNEFFYSPDNSLSDVQYLQKNRESLVKVLQNAWIDDFATAEAYLNEFDRRTINIREIAD